MTKVKYIFLFIITVLISCAEKTKHVQNEIKVEVDVAKEEIEIVSKILSELVKFSPLKDPPTLKNIDETDDEYRIRQETIDEEYNKELESIGLSFYIKDTLFIPENFSRNALKDTVYDGLLLQFLSDTLKPKHIDLSAVSFFDSVHLLTERPSLGEIKIGYCGYAGFSRIIFNEKFDKAFVYFYKDCGVGLCGSGHYIMMKKEQGYWMILRNDEIWVS